jgi:membrane associated rhomboid family serine protease
MLEDRDYMRPPAYERRWSLTIVLLVVNAVVFLLQAIVERHSGPAVINQYLALSFWGLKQGFVWQPISFQFLHANLMHLLANLITIYYFGRAIEEALGKVRFCGLYFGSGVAGGLLQVLASYLWPAHFGAGAVVGASAGAFGLVSAFATLYPERVLTLLLFFVIPFSIRAKFLLLGSGLLTLFGILFPSMGGNIAHVAHLGGILVGIAFVKWGVRSDWGALVGTRRRPILRPRELAEVRTGKPLWRTPKQMPAELPPAEFISKEVDPILDKISAHGIQSLTPEERRILQAASAKIDRH